MSNLRANTLQSSIAKETLSLRGYALQSQIAKEMSGTVTEVKSEQQALPNLRGLELYETDKMTYDLKCVILMNEEYLCVLGGDALQPAGVEASCLTLRALCDPHAT